LLSIGLNAQQVEKQSLPLNLKDGDTFVFLGNSITHQKLYTQYIEDFYYTRYPEIKINFINAGVSGDKASDALLRFNNDVAQFKPGYVSVLFGMNDGKYTRFSHDIFNDYKKNIRMLLDQIDLINANIILITPTMYDFKQRLKRVGGDKKQISEVENYNSTLSFYGMWCSHEAGERGLTFVDMFEPLNRISREQRRLNPDFTLINDGIHPDPVGHVIMALAFLEDVGADPVVSTIHINKISDEWEVTAENGIIEQGNKNIIEFDFTANSLPWTLPEEALNGYKLSFAGKKMNREMIYITGLENGNYELLIDGICVGSYSNIDLTQGVNLGENQLTPQYQQSLKVALLNKDKNQMAVNQPNDHLADYIEKLKNKYGKSEFTNLKETGLLGIYFGDPKYKRPTGADVISKLEYHWGEDDPGIGNDWSAIWYGDLISPFTGEIKFSGNTDCGLKLIIGDQEIINIQNESDHSAGTISLEEGKHYPIIIMHSHDGGKDFMELKWSWEGNVLSKIPSENIYYTNETIDRINKDFWSETISEMNLNFTRYKNEFGKYINEIYRINKPVKHKYEIKKSQ